MDQLKKNKFMAHGFLFLVYKRCSLIYSGFDEKKNPLFIDKKEYIKRQHNPVVFLVCLEIPFVST
jgi:hypothetical protein